MPISGINSNYKVQNNAIAFGNKIKETDKIAEENAELERVPDKDEIIVQKKESGLSKAEKKQVIYKSQTNASGWAIFGHLISTLYFGLRSDDTIAKKYNLDTKKDQNFINEIRKKQVIATLPSLVGLPGGANLGLLGWIGFKVFTKPDTN